MKLGILMALFHLALLEIFIKETGCITLRNGIMSLSQTES